ncbi:hypothetical protein [Jiangella endophytica]|uniref:hypothetical protein n=1 Tax=Jiangella endophytica TaxID=1623398 RepID=UPI000E3577B4|nr:hypothetical protein [Jiangella endophytica]
MSAEHTLRQTQTAVHFRFRAGAWERIAEEMGWPSYYAASTALGVSNTTLSRAVTGQTAPGERLMAAILCQLPRHWRHEDVFELVADGEAVTVR